MSGGWLLAGLLTPLAAAMLALCGGAPARLVRAALVAAPLPALAAALVVPVGTVAEWPAALLGLRLELTEVRRLFLLSAALLWTVAGWYSAAYMAADRRERRYNVCWLLSLTGNLGLILAGDIPGFYACFALMTFAAYGLVAHTQDPAALRAARAYLVMAIAGEAMILSALLAIAYAGKSLIISEAVPAMAGWAHRDLAIGLVVFGFGVKTGLPGLHGWLAVAHPAAPTPASAVLSGSMIKAGLLGWLLFLPGGVLPLPEWGSLLIGLGFAAALGAVAIGLLQDQPKTQLAYSSVSQMGVMTVAVGIGLAEPGDWPLVALLVALYALNHAFAKGALFLGVGVGLGAAHAAAPRRNVILAGLALAALALAGAPLTGGAVAKSALKALAPSAPGAWANALGGLLLLSALATTLLLGHFVLTMRRRMDAPPDDIAHTHAPSHLLTPWFAALFAVAGMAWAMSALVQAPVATYAPTGSDLLKSIVPIGAGLALLAWLRRRPTLRRGWPRVPAGDVLVLYERVANAVTHAWKTSIGTALERRRFTVDPLLHLLLPPAAGPDRVVRADARLRAFEVAGMLFLVGLVALLLALLRGGH